MSKITPQDYIDARDDLVRVGFNEIKNKIKLDGVKETADLYDLPESTLELVKTTGSASEYATVVRLEIERAEAQAKLDAQEQADEERLANLYKPTPRSQPRRWHYVASLVILAGLGYLVYLFVDTIVGWIIGGF